MNSTYNLKKNAFLISLVIGLHFLWSGSSYLSWLYNIIDIIERNSLNTNIDILSEGFVYIFQTVGVLLVCLYTKKYRANFSTSCSAFILVSIFHLILIIPAILTSSYVVALSIGLFTNILIGFETGYYLIMITELVPYNKRGLTFGLGYSIGSVGSWILSLAGSGNCLRSDFIIYVYIFIIVFTISLIHLIDDSHSFEHTFSASTIDYKMVALVGTTITLLCIVKGVGFFFPMADITTGNVSLELSRAFYAIGLLLAGIINDYNRKLGAFTCIAALVFPFVLLCLTFSPTYSFYLWILGYIFTGFYTVYRVIVFSDIADKSASLLFLAPMGLMFGRLGDSLGTFIGVSLSNNRVALVFTGAILFIITITVCFFAFLKLYVNITPASDVALPLSPEERMINYAIYHDLSAREREVFPLIIDGKSNSEISSILFVSENTAKFHVRNILKKTGCSNRQELMKDFNEYHA